MKLPKELQKKKKNPQSYSELKKNLINSFKLELKRITKKEKRKILFKKAGDSSIFIDLIDDEIIKNELGLYNAKTHWDESNIEFYLDENDDNEYFRHLNEYPEDYIYLKSKLQYIARHEYGHTFLTSNIYNQKPKEEREILKEVGCNNLKEVPEDKKKEIFKKIKDTAFYKRVEELKKADLVVLLKEFKEFHANYTVLTRIDNEIPKEILRSNYDRLELIIKNLHPRKEEIIKNIKSHQNYLVFKRSEYFYLLFDMISLTYEIYVFGEWNNLIPLFQEHKMIYTLYFIHSINEIFKIIADNNNNFDSMIENIMEMGRIIELIDFEQLVFNNQFPDKIREKLKDYKNQIANLN